MGWGGGHQLTASHLIVASLLIEPLLTRTCPLPGESFFQFPEISDNSGGVDVNCRELMKEYSELLWQELNRTIYQLCSR